jgi:hypothetical protein
MGASAVRIAAVPLALTGIVDQPIHFITVAGTFLWIVDWSRLIESAALRPGTLTPVGFGVYVTVSLAVVLKSFSVWA